MIRAFLLVGVGGFIGSIARLLSQQFAQRHFPFAFPVGTIAVNIVGSLVIGLVYGLTDQRDMFSPETKLFLTAGLCGGFTTFSSFSYETLNLMRSGDYTTAFLYVIVSVVTCLVAVFAGFSIGERL